jgi:phosphate uptake regulator
MKRKVIQIADSTQLISLPRKWAQKFGVRKGDELEVFEKGSTLLIQTHSTEEQFVSDIDLSKLEPAVMRFAHALYKKGADEIRLKFNSPEQLEVIHRMVKEDTIGFEIVHQGKDTCVLKAVAEVYEKEFSTLLRRTFLLMKSMNEGVVDLLKSKDFSTLSNVRYLEGINNKYTGICRRILNKHGYQEPKNLTFMYCTVEELEKMADQYKYLCDTIGKSKALFKKISSKAVKLIERVAVLFDTYYELFFKYDLQKMADNFAIRKAIINDAKTLLLGSNKADSVVAHYIISVSQMIANMMSFRVEMSA